jgi:hypothetical protein
VRRDKAETGTVGKRDGSYSASVKAKGLMSCDVVQTAGTWKAGFAGDAIRFGLGSSVLELVRLATRRAGQLGRILSVGVVIGGSREPWGRESER